MPRSTRWRDVLPGLLVLVAIIAAIAWVFIYARVGALRGDTYRLISLTSEARGVLKGTEVWLAGQKVGQVSDISFRPVSTDTTRRLLLELRILEQYQQYIRHDSHGQIRAGGTLIGQPVVYISAGSIAAPAMEPGDTLELLPQGDTEGATSRIAAAGRNFPEIAANAKIIAEQLRSASGPLSAFGDEGAPVQLEVMRARAGELSRVATRGEGTLGLAFRGGRTDLGARARAITARADTLRALLASDATSLGRFRRDSTLVRAVAELRNDVAIIRTLLERPEGTAGRVLADRAIQLELAQLERELDLIIDDIRSRPFRYLPF